MHASGTVLFLALLVAAVGSGDALAQDTTADLVGFVDSVTLSAKIPNAHARLREGLEGSLATGGWRLVRLDGPTDCGQSYDCMSDSAKRGNTPYVLRLTGRANEDDGYDFALEIFQAEQKKPHKTAGSCDYCDVERFARVAGRLAVQLLVASSKMSTAAEASGQAIKPAGPPVAPPVQPSPALNTVPPENHSLAWVPWALVGTGALALGYGGWALHKDGTLKDACSASVVDTTCERYSSRSVGVVGVVSGAALVLSGLIWMLTTRASAAAPEPYHAALTVRF